MIDVTFIPLLQAGYHYQTMSFTPAHIASQFAIVALYDNTRVALTMADDNDWYDAPKKGW